MPSLNNEHVILIHGFHRSYKDMTPLRNYLLEMGYRVSRINLPLTFSTIEEATQVLMEILNKKIPRLAPGKNFYMVGHSTGGLIIRHLLTKADYKNYVKRCVLIATPNKGYKIADYAEKLSKKYITLYKTMQSLKTDSVNQLELIGAEAEIGAIAGTKSSPLISPLLGGINDGRLEVSTVYYKELKDFITVPYNHTKIHKQADTALLIDNFLQYGAFLPLQHQTIYDK